MQRRNLTHWAFCFGTAAMFLLMLSKNSPLYPMNDWVDVQCFLTVGKGILHGIVPYRDIYEQKGPVLYFVYALAALISQHSFWGVFLVEIAALGAFFHYSMEMIRLFTKDSPWLYLCLPVLAVTVCACQGYAHGGSVETLSLWILAHGLFVVLRATQKRQLLPARDAFFVGVGAAAVVYMKFTIAGFQLGLALFVAIWYLCYEKKPLELLKTIGWFFAGFAALTAPVVVYFLACGALGDFFTVYFYNNLFLYPTDHSDRWGLIVRCLQSALKANGGWGFLVQAGLVWMVLHGLKNSRQSLAVLLSFLGLTVGTYWGGRGYGYYALILAAYAPLGLALFVRVAQECKLPQWAEGKGLRAAVLVAWCAVLLCVGMTNSNNTYLLGEKRENMPPYQFAQVIRQTEDPTLLNFGFLDGGFYYSADVLPSEKFFCTLNISLSEMWSQQREAIRQGRVEFVVTRKYLLEDYGVGSNYTLVAQSSHYFEGVDFTYYLYQLNH